MHMHRTLGAVLGGAALLLSAACSQDLNVTNPNNPDYKRALANPGDVQSLAVSSVRSWYVGSTAVDPWVMLNVTGDLMTMNYGNFGARFNNLEPRIPYANDAANNDAEVAQVPWENQYTTLGEANDVLGALAKGIELPGGTDKYKALALWAQAGSLMQVALVFDKGFAIDETFDVTKGTLPPFKPYSDVETLAQSKLDALIALTQGKDWTYDKSEFPLVGGLNATILNQFANTMAAQLLAYTPRTADEAGKVDWNKVLQYANNGLQQDFVVEGDGNLWWSEFMGYFDLPSWMGVDQRLIHQMSPNVDSIYTSNNLQPPTGQHDARVQIDTTGDAHKSGADYVYVGSVLGSAARGVYMQSPYRHERYMDVSWESGTPFVGPMPYTLKAENDLLKAEALIRTAGNRVLAAQLINNTRVNRGQLPALTGTESDSVFLHAITYEREVELNATNGFGFFALRHMDQLQPGTVRHLPVPASELETDHLPVYTYGGVGNPVMDLSPLVGGIPVSMTRLSGQTQQLELPSGAVMQLTVPAEPRHAPARFGSFK